MMRGAQGFAMDPIRDSAPTYLEYFGVALIVSAIVGTFVWFVVRYVRRRYTREADEIVPLVRDEEALCRDRQW